VLSVVPTNYHLTQRYKFPISIPHQTLSRLFSQVHVICTSKIWHLQAQKYSQTSWPLRQTQIVICRFIPKTDIFPTTPALPLNHLQVFASGVVRVQDQKLQVTSILIEVHTKNGVGQNTSPCKPISHYHTQSPGDSDRSARAQNLSASTELCRQWTIIRIEKNRTRNGLEPYRFRCLSERPSVPLKLLSKS
jgi:hypothetical protein